MKTKLQTSIAVTSLLLGLTLQARAESPRASRPAVSHLSGEVIDDWRFDAPKLGDIELTKLEKARNEIEGWVGPRLPSDLPQIGVATLRNWGDGKSTLANLPVIQWTDDTIEFYYSTTGLYAWTQATLFLTKRADGAWTFSCLSSWHQPDFCGGARHVTLQ